MTIRLETNGDTVRVTITIHGPGMRGRWFDLIDDEADVQEFELKCKVYLIHLEYIEFQEQIIDKGIGISIKAAAKWFVG